MTETRINFEQFIGKKVILTRNVTEDGQPKAVEVEGTVEAANEMGILIKPKGRTQFDLIEAAEVENVELAPETDKSLKAKTMKPIALGKARQHLLDRHGLSLSDVNALSEQDAFVYHEELDHEALGLGHVHKVDTQPSEAGETASE